MLLDASLSPAPSSPVPRAQVGPVGTLEILVVCRGNVCRSRLVEGLLVEALRGTGHRVRSAGTEAVEGTDLPDETLEAAARAGFPLRTGTARRVTAEMVDDADLVLTLGRAHRRELLCIAPRAVRWCFTLLELERVLADPVVRHELSRQPRDTDRWVSTLAALRGLARRPLDPTDDDVADPFRRGEAAMDATTHRVRRAVDLLAAALRDHPVPSREDDAPHGQEHQQPVSGSLDASSPPPARPGRSGKSGKSGTSGIMVA